MVVKGYDDGQNVLKNIYAFDGCRFVSATECNRIAISDA
jgi:hypothetical protein